MLFNFFFIIRIILGWPRSYKEVVFPAYQDRLYIVTYCEVISRKEEKNLLVLAPI